MDRVHLPRSALSGRRLLLRLVLLAFCGGLLLLLSSRPADAAERQGSGLLDPVRTTLKATAREVDALAGRATGSGSSTVGQTTDAARQAAAPPPRPGPGAARSAVASTVQRGAPAVPSPVRRAAPPTRPATSPMPIKATTRPTGPAVKPLTSPLPRVTEPALRPLGPALAPVGSALAPVGSALAPVGAALAPVGAVLAPVAGPVARRRDGRG